MRPARYLMVVGAIWVVAMTVRLYPQFGHTLRIDGRLTSLAGYLDESCGERIGPAAASCLAEATMTGHRLIRREQAKSLLLIEAPLFLYLLVEAGSWALGRRPGTGASDDAEASAARPPQAARQG
jgi:hypothetical protein